MSMVGRATGGSDSVCLWLQKGETEREDGETDRKTEKEEIEEIEEEKRSLDATFKRFLAGRSNTRRHVPSRCFRGRCMAVRSIRSL